MNRLTIDITEQQHQALAAQAARHGKTIDQYARERLFPAETDPAWHALQQLLQTRINEGLAGKTSGKRIGEIVDDELAAGRHA